MSNDAALAATWETSAGVRRSRAPGYHSSSGDSADTHSSDYSSASSASAGSGVCIIRNKGQADSPRELRQCSSCLNGASKVLGLFNKKDQREAQAAMAEIQARCVKPRTIQSAKERGYRKRQAALYNFIEDSEIAGSSKALNINLEGKSPKPVPTSPCGGYHYSKSSAQSAKDRRVNFWDEANHQFRLTELEKAMHRPSSSLPLSGRRRSKPGHGHASSSSSSSSSLSGTSAAMLRRSSSAKTPLIRRETREELDSLKEDLSSEDYSDYEQDMHSVQMAAIENAASSRGRSNGVWEGRMSRSSRGIPPTRGYKQMSPRLVYQGDIPHEEELHFRRHY